MKTQLLNGVLAALLTAGLGSVALAETDLVYGHQLMTQQELQEHRATMRSLPDQEAREAYRLEHHARMQERAREQGVTLPDKPMARGKGMGPGGGGGRGMGPGGGGYSQ